MPTLHFKGKTFVQNHHLAVKYHQLVPKKARSLTDNVSLHDNLTDVLDKLMLRYQVTHPAFYAAYEQSRTIVD